MSNWVIENFVVKARVVNDEGDIYAANESLCVMCAVKKSFEKFHFDMNCFIRLKIKVQKIFSVYLFRM